MPAAGTAGTAALMISAEPNLNPASVKARLMRSARKIPGDPHVGGAGVLDIVGALRRPAGDDARGEQVNPIPQDGDARSPLEDTLVKPPANARLAVAMLVVATLLCATVGHAAPPADATSSVIVQAADAATATRLVAAVGGTVTHELEIIRAVGARLTADQRGRLAGLQGVLRLYDPKSRSTRARR